MEGLFIMAQFGLAGLGLLLMALAILSIVRTWKHHEHTRDLSSADMVISRIAGSASRSGDPTATNDGPQAQSNQTYANKPLKYSKRASLFTSTQEKAFYRTLITAVGDRYELFAKVRLSDIIHPRETLAEASAAAKAYARTEDVDFLICEKESMEPLMVIEFLDSGLYHSTPQLHNYQLKSALESAGVKFMSVEPSHSYSLSDLKQKIVESLKS